MNDKHYLKQELYELIKKDETIFDFIQETSLDGMWYWDLENLEEEWMNPKFWRVLGYDPDEMPHKSSAWQHIINQDDLKAATENFTKHCQNPNHPYNQVVRYTHKNGSTVWIRCRGMAVRDEQGKAVRMLGSHIDITESKRAENELSVRNAIFEESEKITKTGSWELDVQTGQTIWSDEVYAIHEVDKGYDHNKANGIEFYHPDYRETIANAISKTISEQIPFDEELLFIAANKTQKWVRSLGKPIIENAKVTKIIGVIQDITDQKNAELKVLEAKEQFELAVAGTNDGIWDWNIANNKLFLSIRWKEMLGYKESEIEDAFENFLSLIDSEDLQRVQEYVQGYYDGKREKHEIEFKMKHKNGSLVWILSKGKALRDKNGLLYRMAGSHTDISQRKKDEQALQIAKVEAERANRHKSEFLANMSHEIRTPLNAILGFVDILREKITEPESKKHLETIDSSSHHLLGVINDILDFSKLESGKLEVENISFDAQKEFSTIYELFSAKASEKNIDLQVNIDSSLPPIIVADSLRLKQVISNLLSNAIKFTTKSKNVYLNISYADSKLHVSVKDEGIGIAKEKQQKIFGAFSQADSSTTREYGGTGLGLTISNELVHLMGGELMLKSELGEGSEFYFSTPVSTGVVETSEEREEIHASFKGKKALLVEDNKANQMFMKIVLEKLEIEFDTANDGLEALEMFKNNSYDLILMDENMPNMNGIEATKKILAIEQERGENHTPIIALTANALKGDRERFLEAGMDEYLTKPINKKKLSVAIAKVLS